MASNHGTLNTDGYLLPPEFLKEPEEKPYLLAPLNNRLNYNASNRTLQAAYEGNLQFKVTRYLQKEYKNGEDFFLSEMGFIPLVSYFSSIEQVGGGQTDLILVGRQVGR